MVERFLEARHGAAPVPAERPQRGFQHLDVHVAPGGAHQRERGVVDAGEARKVRAGRAALHDRVVQHPGGGALYGLHGDKGTRWTEEYQADIYRHQIEMIRKIPALRGMSPWILTDFRSPRRPLPRIQDFYNRKGLISNRGERKEAFYVLQRFYRELADRKNQLGAQYRVR